MFLYSRHVSFVYVLGVKIREFGILVKEILAKTLS